MITIYKLIDPENKQVMYVGQTSRQLDKRLQQHIKNKKATSKTKWINLLLSKNMIPIIETIEVCNEINWEDREKYWIKYYKEINNNLLNKHEGGKIDFKTKNKNVIKKTKKIITKKVCNNKNYFMNEEDKKTYRILLKYSLVWGNITRGTYNVEMCNLKHNKKILRGLNKTAFDFIKLCQDGTTGKSLYDITEVMQQIDNIKNNLK